VAVRGRAAGARESAPLEPPPHEALRCLGPADREVLLLAEWEGLSPAQIAAVLGCLTVTARGRLHRARDRFRSAFEELLARDCEQARRAVSTVVRRPTTQFAKEDV
jgi:DNA-directed RNA polymerase specialized sigma24 family protein